MYDNDLISLIRPQWRQLLPLLLKPAKTNVNGEASYVCPFCSHGAHGDGLTFDPRRSGSLHCFGCGWSGDILDLYCSMHSCSFKEALESLAKLLGVSSNDSKDTLSKSTQEDIAGFLDRSKVSLVGSPGEVYLKQRGISIQTAQKGGVGYCEYWRHPRAPISIPASPRLIIPTSSESYLARDIRDGESLNNSERKYTKQKVGSVQLYGSLNSFSTTQPVFIVEGEFDALSLMELGKEVIALGSVSSVPRFLKTVADSAKPKHPFIVALDNDSSGQKAAVRVIEGLREQGLVVVDGSDVAGSYKDANEALVYERDVFEQRVIATEREAIDVYEASEKPLSIQQSAGLSIVSTNEYLENEYKKDVARFADFRNRFTGFKNIDSLTSFYPGLYAVGGISSLGKTTFVHQLADQLASRGEHVLYFPIEQSAMELVSKGISRTMYSRDPKSAVASIQLRSGYVNDAVIVAQEEYKQRGKTLYIADCDFSTTALEIRDTVYKYADNRSVAPIVIIDYLQALQSSGESHLAQREAVDLSLRIFKDMQTALLATVIVVSSLNRVNYMTPIGFESFKESGGIEYTCDVVWGIDLMCMDDPIFDTQGHIKNKRDMIHAAKVANPRKVRVVCLKNRYGISNYSVYFDYYPGYDTFVPIDNDIAYFGPAEMETEVEADEVPLSLEEQDALKRLFLGTEH